MNFRGRVTVVLLVLFDASCSVKGHSGSIPTALQSQGDLHATQYGPTFHISLVHPTRRFRASEEVRDGEARVKGIRIAGKYRDYWFADAPRVTQYREFVVVRGYGRTLVYRKSNVRLIQNETNRELDGIAEERGAPIATTLASGHVRETATTASCRDCIQLIPPANLTHLAQSAASRRPRLVLTPVCNSLLDGSCASCGANDFFPTSCCDVSLDPTCGSGGYYDGAGDWVADPCAQFIGDALTYAQCSSYNSIYPIAMIPPRMVSFKSPGVQYYNWYFDAYTFMQVKTPPLSGLVQYTYDWSMNDVFRGRSYLQDVPIFQAMPALNQWCFFHSDTSAFTSTTLTIKDPGKHEMGAFSATLAAITGVTSPNGCLPPPPDVIV